MLALYFSGTEEDLYACTYITDHDCGSGEGIIIIIVFNIKKLQYLKLTRSHFLQLYYAVVPYNQVVLC